jgi:hypothetical protein
LEFNLNENSKWLKFIVSLKELKIKENISFMFSVMER